MKFRALAIAAALLGATALTAPAATAKAPVAVIKQIDGPTDAAMGVIGQPPAGKAQIVFFRPAKWGGGGVSFSVRENDQGIIKLGNGTYGIAIVDPGKHVFEMKSEATDTFTIEVDEGETYYVRQTMAMGLVLWRPTLNPSDEAAFQEASAKLKLTKQKATSGKDKDREDKDDDKAAEAPAK